MRREGIDLKLYEAGWFEGEPETRAKCHACLKTVSGHRAWFNRLDSSILRCLCRPCLMSEVFAKPSIDNEQAAIRVRRGPK